MEPFNDHEHINNKNIRRRPTDKQTDQTKQSDGNSKRRRLQEMLLLGNNSSNNNTMQQRIMLDDIRRTVAAKITDLNNKAVELYSKGDFHNASSLFEEATISLRNYSSSITPEVAHKSNNNDNNQKTHQYKKYLQQQDENDDYEDENEDEEIDIDVAAQIDIDIGIGTSIMAGVHYGFESRSEGATFQSIKGTRIGWSTTTTTTDDDDDKSGYGRNFSLISSPGVVVVVLEVMMC